MDGPGLSRLRPPQLTRTRAPGLVPPPRPTRYLLASYPSQQHLFSFSLIHILYLLLHQKTPSPFSGQHSPIAHHGSQVLRRRQLQDVSFTPPSNPLLFCPSPSPSMKQKGRRSYEAVSRSSHVTLIGTAPCRPSRRLFPTSTTPPSTRTLVCLPLTSTSSLDCPSF